MTKSGMYHRSVTLGQDGALSISPLMMVSEQVGADANNSQYVSDNAV